jgi:acylphosphatase
MSQSERVARRVVVRGHVQGVFYRDSCLREAESRHVTGWVRNLPDGTVEALFEGPEADVASLVEWALVGPRKAVVESSEVANADPAGQTGFEVRD